MPNVILDPTAAKAAIDTATWSIDRIQSAPNVFLFLDSSSGAWLTSSDPTKDKIRKVVFDLVKAGTVNDDHTITTARGKEKLVSDNGYARLVPATAS